MEFFLKESSWKALSERLEIKNFENSPFLTLADTLSFQAFALRDIIWLPEEAVIQVKRWVIALVFSNWTILEQD